MSEFKKGDIVRLREDKADGLTATAGLVPGKVYSVEDVVEDDRGEWVVIAGHPYLAAVTKFPGWSHNRFKLVPGAAADGDPVNHPSHYRTASGVEVIELTEQLDFNRGNAVKYLMRAGKKDGVDELQDLLKSQWYVNRAVEKLRKERGL